MTYIKWMDARGCNAEWIWRRDLQLDVCVCESVGWVIHETDTIVVIAPHRGDIEEDDRQVCGEMVIPIVCILERVALQRVDS